MRHVDEAEGHLIITFFLVLGGSVRCPAWKRNEINLMMGLCFYFVFWYFFYFYKLGLSNCLPDLSHCRQHTFKVTSWTITFLSKSGTCCSVLSRLTLKASLKNCVLSCSPYKFCQVFLYTSSTPIIPFYCLQCPSVLCIYISYIIATALSGHTRPWAHRPASFSCWEDQQEKLASNG